MISRTRLDQLFRSMADPSGSGSLLDSGRVSGLVARDDGDVGLVLSVDGLPEDSALKLQQSIEQRLRSESGVRSIRIIRTAERAAPSAAPASAVPGVRHTLLVGAGKGGVGKSTVAVQLALALRRLGFRVGMLDADIHGPSLHILLKATTRVTAGADKRLIPVRVGGMPLLGMGLLAEPDRAVAWRGPMASGAAVQMATSADWTIDGQPLDFLIVDLPPGTGDIPMALAQKLRPDGAIVVTTPQRLATADARRAVALFGQLGVPVLGVVRNMHGMVLPDGTMAWPFGHGGDIAAATGAELLVDLPLDPETGKAADIGTPPETGPVAAAFDAAAPAIAAQLGVRPQPTDDNSRRD
jgi:ATP-binding protein involved in chromosome partitioning